MTSRAAYINTELAVIAAEGSGYITTNVAVNITMLKQTNKIRNGCFLGRMCRHPTSNQVT
jgi:hypothetical protein